MKARINMLSDGWCSSHQGGKFGTNKYKISWLFLKVWWRSSIDSSSLLSFCNFHCMWQQVNVKITLSFPSWWHRQGSIGYHLESPWICNQSHSRVFPCSRQSTRSSFHYEPWRCEEISNLWLVITSIQWMFTSMQNFKRRLPTGKLVNKTVGSKSSPIKSTRRLS